MIGLKGFQRVGLVTAIGLVGLVPPATVTAADLPEDVQWIWSPSYEKEGVPQIDCFFRKTFHLEDPEQGSVQITCDDKYELFVNGAQVGSGESWKTLDQYDITKHLVSGQNVVAVRASNTDGQTAALAARVVVKSKGNPHVVYPSDESWQTNRKETSNWTDSAAVAVAAAGWFPARVFGPLGKTPPWGNAVQPAGQYGRFRVPPDFAVEWVMAPEDTGSLIAMAFNESGQIVASRENGPLLLLTDKDQDGIHETVEVYSDRIKNCQGILPLDGYVLAVGEGAEGSALYRLDDADRDGRAESAEALVRFKSRAKEHGPHAVELGPDGKIYLVVGNHATFAGQYAPTSPHHDYYEGDLNRPRYEDPGGHARGLKVPAGTILRTDARGSSVELVAGGLRNAYDLAFNRQGDLFTVDSDMEWDIGTPWYRPTRVNLVLPGAEFGWRSGWAKWPAYYIDSLPAVHDLGPGSPTGMVFYEHFKYPVRYHNALFVGDWARGRILVVWLKPQDGSYQARVDVFAEGRPLNVTDMAVGPDGWLYFCTGGRGTAGGIYRIVWGGKVPPQVADLGEGIESVIRQPQLASAWSRQRIRRVQQEIGGPWQSELLAIANDTQRPVPERVRALRLMQLLGPSFPMSLLEELADDENEVIRAEIARLMGVAGDKFTPARLVQLLSDPSARVRREACAALVRVQHHAAPEELLKLLADADRFVAAAARRALEELPVDSWRELVLEDPSTRTFLQGATALLAVQPNAEAAGQVLRRCRQLLAGEVQNPGYPKGYISDADFLDLLRVIQIALFQGDLAAQDAPKLGQQLAAEYPSQDAAMNRELAKILIFLNEPSAVPRMFKQLSGDLPMADKLQLALHLPRLKTGLTTAHKLQLCQFYETSRGAEGGESLKGYVDFARRDLAAGLTDQEREAVLAGGAQWPSAALDTLSNLPQNPGKAMLRQIKALDRRLEGAEGEAFDRLRVGIVAVLGRSRDSQAMLFLRDLYWRDPSRREAVAMGLAQDPSGPNWSVLVQSLNILDGIAAAEVLGKLAKVDRRPDDPESIRQAILCGLRSKKWGGPKAVLLLEKWTDKKQSTSREPWKTALAKWQTWFGKTYPHLPKPALPKDAQTSKWTYHDLLRFLDSKEGEEGDPERGSLVYQQAQCLKCHRFENRGDRIGPDLSTVSRRFHKKEILQAILFPSQVISDQYASKTVLTNGGRLHTGIEVPDEPGTVVLLDATGKRIEIAKDDIDEVMPSTASIMPEGLLNELSRQDVADLFAFLNGTGRANVTSRRRVRSQR